MHDGAGSESSVAVAEQAEPATDIDRLYAYAAWMIGDRSEALRVLRRALADPIPPGARFKDRLHGLRSHVLSHHSGPRASQIAKMRHLDEVLRKGTSISMPMNHPLLRNDAKRLPVLLNGFMQSCMIAAVQTLSPAVREVFVLLVILELPEDDVRTMLDLAAGSMSASKSRMMQGLESYFEPRCSHLDRNNPCHCERRLLLALDQKFVAFPPHERPSNEYPYGVYYSVKRLFEVLPALRLSDETVRLLEPNRA